MAGIDERGAEIKRPPIVAVLRVFLAGIVMVLLSSGWPISDNVAAYLAVGCAGLVGIALIAGRPRADSIPAFALVIVDSIVISILVYDTGGMGSPFLPVYLLGAFGLIAVPGLTWFVAATAVLLAGYLAAVASFDSHLGVLLTQEILLKLGLLVLFCVLAGLIGRARLALRANARSLSEANATAHGSAEQFAALSSNLAPVLKVLDVGGILDWLALTVQTLLNAPYVHVALIDNATHRTRTSGSLDTYPSWWHPDIQRVLLWSSRTGEIVREEVALPRLQGIVAVPIVSREGRGLGAIVIGGSALSPREEYSLTLLSTEVASVLEEAEDAPAGREPVSGLPNLTSLKRVLDREVSSRNAITLLMLKLNRLQGYQLVHGIEVGDRLIGKIGARLNEEHQRVFQHGNALVIVLKSSSRSKAQKTALRARQTVSVLTADAAVPQDASVGFVILDPEVAETPDLILETATNAATRADSEPDKIFGASIQEVLTSPSNSIARELEQGPVLALLEAARIRHPYLEAHMRTVSQLSLKVGHELGLSREQLDALVTGALLHDIGKIGIPDSILAKSGPLTRDEYEIMKTHTTLGAEILAREASLLGAIRAVKHHHERYDGKGYPDGLSEENIPLNARIVCVVDALDSLVRDKVYQRGVTEEVARNEILRHAGTQFDPHVVSALVAVLNVPESRQTGTAN
ncbi:hypothetical protein BH23ACT11_BH23ACT11_00940 [soil metagenome]